MRLLRTPLGGLGFPLSAEHKEQGDGLIGRSFTPDHDEGEQTTDYTPRSFERGLLCHLLPPPVKGFLMTREQECLPLDPLLVRCLSTIPITGVRGKTCPWLRSRNLAGFWPRFAPWPWHIHGSRASQLQ